LSEKRDLWVPAMLFLTGTGLLTWHLMVAGGAGNADGSALIGGLAMVIGFFGAIACLPLRIRRGQARVVGFGVGMMLILAALAPGQRIALVSVFPWVLAALAFLVPIRTAPLQTRGVMLGGAGLFAILSALSAIGLMPATLTWLFVAGAFFLAAQVWSSRVRPEKPPPPGPRICVFGGTFDPWHRGHRALAEAALGVNDRLLVVVAGSAPHKFLGEEGQVPDRTPFHHRVAMTRLGVEGLPRTEVLELEGRRAGPSYTVDTLDVLFRSHPAGTRFRLLVGADMYLDFPNWKDWETILEHATLLVAKRPGVDLQVPPELEGRDVPMLGLEAPEVDISASQIREAIAEDATTLGDARPLEEVLQPTIRAYIGDHGLYDPVPEA